ncbi:MAG: hypothetical protein M3N31_00470 [Actinomycetota bacterium]|nr:hypothetical protein [Actinomycetota bacterium]
MLAVIIFLFCLLVALAAYGALYQLGVIPGSPTSTTRSAPSSGLPLGGRTPLQEAQRSGREVPHGCLTTVIVVGVMWFLLWGAVLVFALRFLADPYG